MSIEENLEELVRLNRAILEALTNGVATPVDAVKEEPAQEAQPGGDDGIATTDPFLSEEPVGKSKYFKDQQEVLDYVVAKYKEIGHEKGKMIQVILERMGRNTLSDLMEHEWDAFKEEIDKL